MFAAINKLLDPLESVAMVLFMTIATLLTTTQVVLRYVFGAPLFWAEEVVIYSIICMSFVGASMGVRYGVHISVDILHAVLPPSIGRWIRLGAASVGIIFALVLGYLGFLVFQNTLDLGQRSPAMGIPMAWVYLPITISAAFMTIRYLQLIVEAWNEPPRSLADEIAKDKDKLV